MAGLSRPCVECPFTRGDKAVRLTRGRARELARNALDFNGRSFSCHKTVDYDDDGDGVVTDRSKECAGSLLFGHKQGCYNQTARILGRIGLFDPDAMTGADLVFDSTAEMVASALDAKRQRQPKTATPGGR